MEGYSRFRQVASFRMGDAGTVVAKLRDLAPYALMALVLPGGSLMAVLLWSYRRRKGFAH